MFRGYDFLTEESLQDLTPLTITHYWTPQTQKVGLRLLSATATYACEGAVYFVGFFSFVIIALCLPFPE